MRSLSRMTMLLVTVVLGWGAASLESRADDLRQIRVGWCTSTINSGALPWAVAQKMGYFAKEGIDLKLVPIASGNQCVTYVANGELPYSLPALEPMASIVAKGFAGKTFFTLYHGTTWRIAVPENSKIKSVRDMKGARIGVASMASVMVAVTKGLLGNAGLDGNKDATFIAVGAPANSGLALKRGEIDAVAMWDIADMQIERTGIKLRELDVPEFGAPSLGIFTSDSYFEQHKDEAVKLAKAYAKGATFALANPKAALEMMYALYPETNTPGIDKAALLENDLEFVQMRRKIWEPIAAQNNQWGRAIFPAYEKYLGNLDKWAIIDKPVGAKQFVTNELIDQINDFDRSSIVKIAKAQK
jgi:NitT/TauT family transport system substrate-binding protein